MFAGACGFCTQVYVCIQNATFHAPANAQKITQVQTEHYFEKYNCKLMEK